MTICINRTLKFGATDIGITAWPDDAKIEITLWKPSDIGLGRVEWFSMHLNAEEAILLARDLTWFPDDEVVRSVDANTHRWIHLTWYKLSHDGDRITLHMENRSKTEPSFFFGAMITMEQIEAKFLAMYLFLFVAHYKLPKETIVEETTILLTEDKKKK